MKENKINVFREFIDEILLALAVKYKKNLLYYVCFSTNSVKISEILKIFFIFIH